MHLVQQILIGIGLIGAKEEFAMSRRTGNKIGHRACVGQITTSLTGNAHLLPYNIVFFKKQDICALLSCGQSRKNTGRSGANDNHSFQCYVHPYLYLYNSAISSGVRRRYAPRLTPLSVRKAYWTRRRLYTCRPKCSNMRRTWRFRPS